MKNIKKIIILILIILLGIFIITIIKFNKNRTNIKTENQIQQDLSVDPIQQVTIKEEKILEEQEVEDEGFELQGEIAYEDGKAQSWNLKTTGTPKLTYVSQIDNRWKNHPYTIINSPNQTIGTSGCGVAASAMIIESIVGNISVPELADTFVKYGYRSPNNGTYWSVYRAVADEFNIEYRETSNFSVMLELLKNNHYIIASVGNGLFTTGGHYIMIYGIDGENLKIYDPYLYKEKFSTSTRRGKAYINGDTVYCSKENFKNYANYKRFFCYKYNEKNTANSSKKTEYTKYVKVSSRLNVRNGASKNNKIVGKLNNGTKVTVYETRGNWSKIGNNRWVASNYLTEKNVVSKNLNSQYKRLKYKTYLYSKSNLTGIKYTYLAKTKVKIIKHISNNVDYVYVVKTGRYAYIRRSAYN